MPIRKSWSRQSDPDTGDHNSINNNSTTDSISTEISSETVSSDEGKNPDFVDGSLLGWVIVFASFIIQFIGDGVAYSFGLFFVEISDEFSNVGKSGVSWIASIMIAATHAVGPVGSILVNKFGCREISIFGSVLAAIGFGTSYFAQNVVTLYFTVGLIGGLGFGLMYLPAMVIIPHYFVKRRAFAVGIAVCGSGLGTFFFEWIFGFILGKFTWRQGLAIASGIIISSVIFAMMYRPAPKQNTIAKNIESPPPPTITTKSRKCDALRNMIDLTLLKNPLFLIFSICDMLSSIGFNVPYVYLPEIEKEEVGLSSRSTLLGIIGVANVLSRLLLGYLSDKKFMNRLYLYNCALILAGIGTIVSPHLTTIWWLRGYAGMYGACMGTYISLKSVILVDLIGLDRLTDAFGLMLLIQSVGFVIGPPIVGRLYDIYGIYKPGFYFAGATFVLSGTLLFSIPFLKSRTRAAARKVAANHYSGNVNHGIDISDE